MTLLGRRALWEEAVSNFSSSLLPLPPPAKMSDMEDDFMCDDEEDYDLVRRREWAGAGSGTWWWGRGRAAAALPRGASALFRPAP